MQRMILNQLHSFSFPLFIKKNFFWPDCEARGILVPQPGIEPMSPAVEV